MIRLRQRATRAVYRGLQASLAVEALRFSVAADDPHRAQRKRLAAVLDATRDSRQGRALALQKVHTAREFQAAVPLQDALTLTPSLEALVSGAHDQLTSEAPLRVELSGGSSGPSKPVPMTRALLAEFQRALAPWLFDLLTWRPALRRGPAYWSISPLGARGGRTPSGLPIGSASDSSYFPALLRPLVELALAVPGDVAGLPDVDTCRYVTLRLMLERADVAFISVWNPSFLTLLLESLDANLERLADDLATGQCRPPRPVAPAQDWEARVSKTVSGLVFRAAPDAALRLRRVASQNSTPTAKQLFEGLALVSCWTDATAARALPALEQRLGGVEVQGKGLLATEGVVSFPVFDAPAPVLAVRSHFYEFLEEGRVTPLLAHELQAGRRYEVVMSTSGGLLRYRLGDVVRVEGFWRNTPCLTLMGRSDAVVDLVGEKLSAQWASVALSEALGEVSGEAPVPFAMLGPEWCAPPAYHLFVEAPLSDAALTRLAASLEARLTTSHPYGYARQLGQLGPVRAVRVHNGRAGYEARCVALGQRAGDIKPVDLHRQPGWLAHFAKAGP